MTTLSRVRASNSRDAAAKLFEPRAIDCCEALRSAASFAAGSRGGARCEEREVLALGRSFGAHSVGMGEDDPSPPADRAPGD